MILEDEKFLDFKKSFEDGTYSINSKKLIKEIQDAHVTRSVRILNTDQVLENNKMVVDALINNQVTRSRIVEIKMQASSADMRLKYRIENLINYLTSQYKDELTSFKTQTERKAYVKSMFDFTQTDSTNTEIVQKFADVIIDDLDKASWTLKSIIDCLKINDAVVHNTL